MTYDCPDPALERRAEWRTFYDYVDGWCFGFFCGVVFASTVLIVVVMLTK